MKTVCVKRLTIVCDGALELDIAKEIRELGATGYTFTHAHGAGVKGIRPNRWHLANLRIEIVASPELADRILEHVSKKYFERYGVIAWLDDVEVVRGEKFGS